MFKVAILQKRAINAQIDKNIETSIMAKNMQIFFYCRNALLQDMIYLCHMKKVFPMMIQELQKYVSMQKNIKLE